MEKFKSDYVGDYYELDSYVIDKFLFGKNS